jgi:hypothetical protein
MSVSKVTDMRLCASFSLSQNKPNAKGKSAACTKQNSYPNTLKSGTFAKAIESNSANPKTSHAPRCVILLSPSIFVIELLQESAGQNLSRMLADLLFIKIPLELVQGFCCCAWLWRKSFLALRCA